MYALPVVPAAITQLIDDWAHAGRPLQQPIGWNRDQWFQLSTEDPRYPHVARFGHLLNDLPNPIGREDVRGFASLAASSPTAALEAFVATMVWGFGRRGYGAFRTHRILSANPVAGENLQRVAEVLLDDGAVEGYRAMANEQRLKWLGPAFGTKYLHFCSDRSDSALVLDDLVATWLNEHCSTQLQPTRWSTTQYGNSLSTMALWSTQRCTATELETLIFVAEASQRTNSQWAP